MVYILILLAGFSRVITHPANFTAINAVGIFGGKYLDKKSAVISIIFIMLFTDALLGFYDPKIMLTVYISLIFSTLFGQYLKNHFNFKNLILAILTSSTIFFILTNLAVFFFSGMYILNFSGLVRCFALALPFYRNMLLGDIFYTTVIFGTYKLLNHSKLNHYWKGIYYGTNRIN
ncbi:MAG: hypothetical protein UR93_C0001G0019 [Berkelbacteria bacterium GW2011_GWA2_35_9]|uniref:Uncharacterized protein n=1 Tax=Berkelbacteria bacterium GW2011_GWA2_35_9 TaxID=1618333 RepID=A0A0G0GBW0_9BACT|nr:MAG: hypothetical protein UR93_C0001G0019 [Berkelbacteria bacterium GW2011_GWA2_35_9]